MTLEEKLDKLYEDAKKTWSNGFRPVRHRTLRIADDKCACLIGAAAANVKSELLEDGTDVGYEEARDAVKYYHEIGLKLARCIVMGFDDALCICKTPEEEVCYAFGKRVAEEVKPANS